MRAQDSIPRRGFTLIELMIVVAIIGLLASAAIPGFIRYQTRAKRAEAPTNLSSLAQSQNAFFAEHGVYVPVPSEPFGSTGTLPGTGKRDSTGFDGAFGVIGWAPDGDVFFDYDTNANCGTCPTGVCFTAAAYGDLDGNTDISMVIYVHPDPSETEFCPSGMWPLIGTPPVNGSGDTMWNQAVLRTGANVY